MKTELLIEYFDLETEYFIGEIDISKYDLKKINNICHPRWEEDYQYANGHELDKREFNELKKYIEELQNMDFSKYSYGIITRQIL